jgi:hypothetical protein
MRVGSLRKECKQNVKRNKRTGDIADVIEKKITLEPQCCGFCVCKPTAECVRFINKRIT